ncbi:MAG: hypothetical protein AB7I37_04880 [Pirellulales bacterium]
MSDDVTHRLDGAAIDDFLTLINLPSDSAHGNSSVKQALAAVENGKLIF